MTPSVPTPRSSELVPTSVSTVSLTSVSAAALSCVDGLVIPWWADADAASHVDDVRSFFLGGGDLFVLSDDPGHDAVSASLGLPTIGASVAATPKPTTGSAPLSARSEEHTSELQPLMRLSYAVFFLKNKPHTPT